MPLAPSPARVPDHSPFSMTPRPAISGSAAGPSCPRSGARGTSPATPGRGWRSSRGCPRPAPSSPCCFDPGRERIQRVMRRAPGPKPVGEAEEVRLVDAVEHLHDGALKDLVLQRGDTERPQPPVPFGDVRPSRPASPDSSRNARARADPEDSPRDQARTRATSRRPPRARPSAEAPRYAALRRSTST